jgi:hypothetical protein
LSSAALYWLIGTNPSSVDADRSEELSCYIRSEIVAVLKYWLDRGDGLRDILDNTGLLERMAAFVDEIRDGGLDARTVQETVVVNEVAGWWSDVYRALLDKMPVSGSTSSDAVNGDLSRTIAAFQHLKQAPGAAPGDQLFDSLDTIGSALARVLSQNVSWVRLEQSSLLTYCYDRRCLRIYIPLARCLNDSLVIPSVGIIVRIARARFDRIVTW